jgi:4-diphosphocytidyl-2-C-methyl-D-erythritol kinase
MAAPARAASSRNAAARAPAAALRVRCPAKVNLGLWVGRKRADGYHEVETFLQAISLEDEIVVSPGPPGLSLEMRGLRIPGPGPNLIERAWKLLSDEGLLPRGAGLHARLTKRIPVGAGLGGGSSDAAGFLVAVERFLALQLSESDRLELAKRLGSDVTFFLRGGLARATGRGERVRHLCPIKPFWLVLATPATAISTTWAYAQLRNRLTPEPSGATFLASAITRGDLMGVVGAMHNAFEAVVLPQLPEIAVLKRVFASSGAMGALLAGSGSTVYGIASSRIAAQAVLRAVGRRRAEVRVARSIDHGVVVSQVG